jgi:hypothetical protein
VYYAYTSTGTDGDPNDYDFGLYVQRAIRTSEAYVALSDKRGYGYRLIVLDGKGVWARDESPSTHCEEVYLCGGTKIKSSSVPNVFRALSNLSLGTLNLKDSSPDGSSTVNTGDRPAIESSTPTMTT